MLALSLGLLAYGCALMLIAVALILLLVCGLAVVLCDGFRWLASMLLNSSLFALLVILLVLAALLNLGGCTDAGAVPVMPVAVASLAMPPLLVRMGEVAAVFVAIGAGLWLAWRFFLWAEGHPRRLAWFGIGAVYVLVLFLTGCASVEPHEARHKLLGMTTPDLLACMGPPAERDNTVPRLKVWTWSYVDPGAGIAFGSMSALGMGLSLQEHGSCRAIIAMSGGHVTSVHYSPAQDGIAGPLGACRAIVSDCLAYPTHTPLAADFHPDAPEPESHAAER